MQAYTIANESQHLFIYGVPTINLRPELKNLCTKYGQILSLHVVADHKTEIFTECYHIYYSRIQSARIAKRQLDNRSFYGGVLHVCYAPERESVEDTRAKLLQRSKDVLSRLYGTLEKDNERKRLHENDGISEAVDPMEPVCKAGKTAQSEQEAEEGEVVYGPQLPATYEKEYSELEVLAPYKVVDNSICIEKKIIFRNK